MPIDITKWRQSSTAAQLAKKFEVEQGTIYTFAKRHGLSYKKTPVGAKKKSMKAPTLPKHKKIIMIYRDPLGTQNIGQIAKAVRMSYHATYRVIQRYKVYRSKQVYHEEGVEV